VQNVVKIRRYRLPGSRKLRVPSTRWSLPFRRVADDAKVLLDIANRSREEEVTGIQTMEKTTDGLNRTNQAIQSSAEIINILRPPRR